MADNKAKDSKLAVPKDAESTTSSKDTGYVKGDDTFTRWRNIFAIVSGQMTDQGKEQFRLARDIQFEQQDCRRCESYRDYLLKYSTYMPSPFLYLFSSIFHRRRRWGN